MFSYDYEFKELTLIYQTKESHDMVTLWFNDRISQLSNKEIMLVYRHCFPFWHALCASTIKSAMTSDRASYFYFDFHKNSKN